MCVSLRERWKELEKEEREGKEVGRRTEGEG